LVGTSFPVTAVPDDSVAVSPELAEFLDRNTLVPAERYPLIEQREALLSAARADARAARTSYLPTISASANRGGFGFDRRYGFGDPYRYSTGFNLSLNFPLLNGLQREESVVRANVNVDNAEALLRDAQLRVQQELTQGLGLLRNAGQRVAVQLVSVAATEEDLRLQQQRYALGAATVLDVLTSQAALNVARNALITARFDERVARARLEALLGRSLASER
jgi:outer membrane protein